MGQSSTSDERPMMYVPRGAHLCACPACGAVLMTGSEERHREWHKWIDENIADLWRENPRTP